MKIDFYALLISEAPDLSPEDLDKSYYFVFGDTELETVLDEQKGYQMIRTKIIEIDFNNLNMFIRYQTKSDDVNFLEEVYAVGEAYKS